MGEAFSCVTAKFGARKYRGLRDKDLELEDLRGGGATLSLPKLETSRHNRCCFWTGRHYPGSSSTRENQHDIKMCSDLWEKLFLVLQESLEQESIEDSEIRTLNKNWPKFLNSLCSLLRDKDLELEDFRGWGATLSLPKLETSRHNRCCFSTGRHYPGSSSTRENMQCCDKGLAPLFWGDRRTRWNEWVDKQGNLFGWDRRDCGGPPQSLRSHPNVTLSMK